MAVRTRSARLATYTHKNHYPPLLQTPEIPRRSQVVSPHVNAPVQLPQGAHVLAGGPVFEVGYRCYEPTRDLTREQARCSFDDGREFVGENLEGDGVAV